MRSRFALARWVWLPVAAGVTVTACVLDFDGLSGGEEPAGGGAGGGTSGSAGTGTAGMGPGGGPQSAGAAGAGSEVGGAAGSAGTGGVLCPNPAPTLIRQDVGLANILQHRLAVSGETLFFSRPFAFEVWKWTPGEPAEIIYVHDSPAATPVTFAANQSYLFWSTEQRIHRCDLPDCDSPVEVAPMTLGAAAPSLAVGAGEEVYWIAGLNNAAGEVRSCTGVCPGGATLVSQNLSRPRKLALDATHVYWTAHGENDLNDGLIWRATRGDPPGAASVYLAGIPDPAGLAVVDGYIYYSSDMIPGRVFRCHIGTDTTCDPSEELSPNPPSAGPSINNPHMLAVDDTNVYFAQSGGDQYVLSCPRAGCGDGSTYPTVLGAGYDYPSSITLSDACIFWYANDPTGQNLNGAIFTMPRPD